jgi:choline dehydrogenase-like flavoprotein
MEQPKFDYIIVRGRTAGIPVSHFSRKVIELNVSTGCVLASRLSLALPGDSILLIEAGPENDDRVALSQALAISDRSNIQWNNRTVPQKALNGRTMSQEQGKILGGSSAINYQTWTRGAAVEL